MFKYTPSTLQRIENLFKEAGYIVRYEKGNFKSGFCILETKKVVVVNKYFTLDARIDSLIEILSHINIDAELLSEKSMNIFNQTNSQNTIS